MRSKVLLSPKIKIKRKRRKNSTSVWEERCPSGRRSTIGNRVPREIGVAGSNPALSVRFNTVDYGDMNRDYNDNKMIDSDDQKNIVERKISVISYSTCVIVEYIQGKESYVL